MRLGWIAGAAHAAASPRSLMVYDASPFFFAPGGRNGFAAIEAHPPAIAGLGANALLPSPMTAASPGDFGYAVTDDFRLRTPWGCGCRSTWPRTIFPTGRRTFWMRSGAAASSAASSSTRAMPPER